MTFVVLVLSLFLGGFALILIQPEYRTDLVGLFLVVLGMGVVNAAVTTGAESLGGLNGLLVLPIILFVADTAIMIRFAYVSPKRAALAAGVVALAMVVIILPALGAAYSSKP